MKHLLDALLIALGILIAAMMLTGGGVIGKVEFSSLDPWVLAWGLLAWARLKLGGAPAVPWRWFRNGVERLLTLKRPGWFATGFVCVVFGALAIAHVLRHLSLGTDGQDLTFVHQSLLHLWERPRLSCDICFGGSYFGEHLSFSFYVLAPLLEIFKRTDAFDFWVFALQAALLGAPIVMAIRLGPLKEERWLWGLAALLIVSHRALRNAVVWDFREDVLIFAGLMGACVALYRGWKASYVLHFAIVLLSKENAGVVLAFLAIPILFDRRLALTARERAGLAIFTGVGAIAWTALAFTVLIPHFNQATEASNNITVRFARFGATPREVLVTLLTSPSAWLWLLREQVLRWEVVKYLVLLVGPYAYFARRAWLWWVPAIPGIAMNVLSSTGMQRSLQFHYDLIILPFLVMALLLGLRRAAPAFSPAATRRLALGLFFALAFSGRWPGHAITENWPAPEARADSAFLRSLPVGDRIVAAGYRPMAQLSRFRVRELRAPVGEASWRALWEANASDRTGIPGHSAREAELMVLDLHEPWAAAIREGAEDSWKVRGSSPSGRYVVLERALNY